MAHYSEIRDQSIDHDQELDTEYPEEEGFLKKCHHPEPTVPFYRRHSKAIFVHSCMLLLNFLIALSLWSSALYSCPYGVYGPELVPSKRCTPFGHTQSSDKVSIFSASKEGHFL